MNWIQIKEYCLRAWTSHFARFSGRSGRRELASVGLMHLLIFLLLTALGYWVFDPRNDLESYEGSLWQLWLTSDKHLPLSFALAYLVIALPSSLSLVARRLHDIGYSSLYALLYFSWLGMAILLGHLYTYLDESLSDILQLATCLTSIALSLALLIVCLKKGETTRNAWDLPHEDRQ